MSFSLLFLRFNLHSNFSRCSLRYVIDFEIQFILMLFYVVAERDLYLTSYLSISTLLNAQSSTTPTSYTVVGNYSIYSLSSFFLFAFLLLVSTFFLVRCFLYFDFCKISFLLIVFCCVNCIK